MFEGIEYVIWIYIGFIVLIAAGVAIGLWEGIPWLWHHISWG